jgi:hypothetical protein
MITDTRQTCHVRPKYNDGNKIHPYCSKTCSNTKVNPSQNNKAGSVTGAGTCNVCLSHHFRSVLTLNFPSFAMLDLNIMTDPKPIPSAPKRVPRPAPVLNRLPLDRMVTISCLSASATDLCPPATCRAPGCQKAAFTNTNGAPGEYCCMSHKS